MSALREQLLMKEAEVGRFSTEREVRDEAMHIVHRLRTDFFFLTSQKFGKI